MVTMPMSDERTEVQSNLDRLATTMESLDPRMRGALARFLRASPATQAAAMATSPETALVLPLLVQFLDANPQLRPIALSLLEGG
jgi:hypothetical protein